MEPLTAQEEAIMLYIWKLAPCFIRDILNEMPRPKPPYTSVASIIRKLERKHYISGIKLGPIIQYLPVIRERDYKRIFMSNIVRNYFSGSYKEIVFFFIRDRKLSKEDLQDLIGMMENEKEF